MTSYLGHCTSRHSGRGNRSFIRNFALTVATRGQFCHPVSRTSARRKCTSVFLSPLLSVCPSVGRDCIVRLGCTGCGSPRGHIRRLQLRNVTRAGHCTSASAMGGTVNAARLRGVMMMCGKVRVEMYRRIWSCVSGARGEQSFSHLSFVPGCVFWSAGCVITTYAPVAPTVTPTATVVAFGVVLRIFFVSFLLSGLGVCGVLSAIG